MQQNLSEKTETNKTDFGFFSKNGFLIKEKFFDNSVISAMKNEVFSYLNSFDINNTLNGEDFLYEDNSQTLRLIRNVHNNNKTFANIINDVRLFNLVENLAGRKLEVINTKVNFKNGFTGGHFDWHQDSIYLGKKNENAMALIVAIDDISHENGPIMVMPHSHHHGMIDVPHRDDIIDKNNPLYPKARTDNLPYSLPNDTLTDTFEKNGIKSFVGNAGTLFAMHCSTFHASGLNLTPYGRASLLIRYGYI
jgi:ectoine hydroxylase